MSEAKDTVDEPSGASGCYHGGEQRAKVADRYHEPVLCHACCGTAADLSVFVKTMKAVPCPICNGTGLAKDTA
jgi:hypothetical protein